MKRAYYMHVLNGKPAEFNPIYGTVTGAKRRVRLVGDLAQIRREQTVSGERDQEAGATGSYTYSHITVVLP